MSKDILRRILFVIALLPSVVAARAEERPEILTTITLERMAEIMQKAGYRAEIDAKNKRVITGLSGFKAAVTLYGCDNDNKCSSFQLWAIWQPGPRYTLEFVNAYNAGLRYAKAYVYPDQALILEYDVGLTGGVTPEFIKQQVVNFEQLLPRLQGFDYKIKTPSDERRAN